MSLRVAIVADYLEEGWASMDLVAEMLTDHLRREHRDSIMATLIRPTMPRRLGRMPLLGEKVSMIDRLVARQWDYPRVLSGVIGRFDVYHVIDHSYAHLVHALPPERTLVTCHDIDAFRSVLEPEEERRSVPFKWMSRRILDGLRSAAHVACDSEATRLALVRLASIPSDRLSVVPNGSDVRRLAEADAAADVEAARLVGFRGGAELLHVGTTVPRKRVDVLIEMFAVVRARRPDVRLIRVGGPFTAAQRAQARDLGVLDAVVVLPFVDRATLAAVYRRAALALLPSEREGFGLPLVESLASGTPVVASDIPVLREVGAAAASYCPVADINAWSEKVLQLLAERDGDAAAWRRRRDDGIARSADFSWSRYAQSVAELYQRLASGLTTGQMSRGGRAPQPSPERVDG
jgi:glycosyltransferase involved in cell wall biosynthesis